MIEIKFILNEKKQIMEKMFLIKGVKRNKYMLCFKIFAK